MKTELLRRRSHQQSATGRCLERARVCVLRIKELYLQTIGVLIKFEEEETIS